MKIELKNVKIAEFASEETLCFEATVYVDGKRSFLAKNDGQGGCNYYRPFDPAGQDALRKAAEYTKTLLSGSFENITTEMSLDVFIDDLLEHFQLKQQIRRMCKGRTLFRLPNMPRDEYRQIKIPFSESVRAAVLAKHGNSVQFLNDQL